MDGLLGLGLGFMEIGERWLLLGPETLWVGCLTRWRRVCCIQKQPKLLRLANCVALEETDSVTCMCCICLFYNDPGGKMLQSGR